MGNTFSMGNNVFVYTDKGAYYSGDTITGYVLLNCVKPFDCKSIILSVKGEEDTYFEERRIRTSFGSEDSHGMQKTINHDEIIYHRGSEKFFSQKVVLQSFPHQCQPGQYQYPFSVTLPLGMPGTFTYNVGHENARAYVQYKIKAECDVHHGFDVTHSQEIIVYQRPTRLPTEIKSEHFQEVYSCCCCCSQGNCHLIAHIQKDSYVPGETANVVLQADNMSDASFDRIELYLQNKVNLKSHVSVYEHGNEQQMSKSTMPGLPAKCKFWDKDAKVLSLALPMGLAPSVAGRLIHNEYSLCITLHASGMTSSVKLKVPLTIFPPPPPHEVFNQPPPYWHPTHVAEPVVINMPSAPPLPPQTQTMSSGQPTYAGPPAQPGYPPQGQPGYPPEGYPPQG